MTREEAHQLIAQHEGGVCVRLYRRADGTVITADCPVGKREATRPMWWDSGWLRRADGERRRRVEPAARRTTRDARAGRRLWSIKRASGRLSAPWLIRFRPRIR